MTQPEAKLEYIVENQRLREVNAALLKALEEALKWRDEHDSYMLPGPWFFTARAAIEAAK